jgi:hypothetical protein
MGKMTLSVKNTFKDNSNKELKKKMKISTVDSKEDISTDDNSDSASAEWNDFNAMEKPTKDIGTDKIGNPGKKATVSKQLGLISAIAIILFVGLIGELIFIIKLKKQM